MNNREQKIETYKEKLKYVAAYKMQLNYLKEQKMKEKQEELNNASSIAKVNKLGKHPMFNRSSNSLFKNDQHGYLSALLLGALVFVFEIAFLALNYFIFKN